MATVIDAIIHLTDQFTPNLAHIREELSETERTTRRSAREVSRLGESITSVGEAMLPAAAAIAGGIGISVKQFADFESIITQAGLKADATEAEIKAMGDAVIAAGAKFPVSMDETAKAMDRLAAGGFNAQQSIAALAPVIQAAVASGEDMGAVSDVVTSALSSWHLLTDNMEETTKNAETVADVIQMASNKSKLGVQDLGVAFQYAAPNAAALGDSVKTVSAILAVMANNGIAASTAGTSLRSAYLNLASGAKPAREALEQLGLEVFKADGSFKGMRTLLDDLRGKLKGMSDADATPILRKLFGTEGVSAILGYINTAEEETNKMFDAMENAQGSSAAAFEKMSKTLSGQLNAIQGAFQAFVIRIGQAAAPMLAPFVASLQSMIETLKAMPDEQIQTLIRLGIGFVGLTAGVLALGKALSILGSIGSFLAPIGTALADGATLTSLFMAKIAPIGTVLNH
ncbi:MAG: phage tail tape measure protein, partial [Selenomonadaceae bacterium]|nr:phage tail tape measure protein [Selenomonadaceae bacterium]